MPKSNNALHIISGKFRGHRLKSPSLDSTHPMGAREKLALFNMVNVEQATVLDAYAGSGALGIEALSRGASEIIFVENNRKSCHTIQENLTSLSISTNTTKIFPEKLSSFLQHTDYLEYFAVIFADPPYDDFQPSDLGNIYRLLQPNGLLALSSPAELTPPELPHLRLSSTHTYARARISIYYRSTE